MKPLPRLIVLPFALALTAAEPPALKLAPPYTTAPAHPARPQPPGPPPGAAARCNDGAWVFGPDGAEACGPHGGVRFETELAKATRRRAQRRGIELAGAILIALAACLPFLRRRGARAGATGLARWSLIGLLAVAIPTLLITSLALPFTALGFIINAGGIMAGGLSLPALALLLASALVPAAWAGLVVVTAVLALDRYDALRLTAVFGSAAALAVFVMTVPDAALMFRVVGRLLGF